MKWLLRQKELILAGGEYLGEESVLLNVGKSKDLEIIEVFLNLIITCDMCFPFITLLDLCSSRNYQKNEDNNKTKYTRYRL